MKIRTKFWWLPLLSLCIVLALAGCASLPIIRNVPGLSDTGTVSTLENSYEFPDGSSVSGITGSVSPSSEAPRPAQPSGQTQLPSTAGVGVQATSPAKPASTIATTAAPTYATTNIPPAVRPSTAAPTTPAATVDDTIRSLLAAGLDAGYRDIDLSPFLATSPVSVDQIPNILLRVQSIYHALLDDRPDYYYLDGSNTLKYETTGGTRMSRVVLVIGTRDPYDSWTSANMVSARLALIAKADEIAGLAAGRPSAWQKLLFIHDTLVQRVTYDAKLNQVTNNAAGALLGGSTLCQGYAQAFQLVAQRCGLAVSIISGTAEGVSHAWNLVKLDGKTYHIDVTFDDPVASYDISPIVFHSHFLRSDSAMASTHEWTRANYPACPTDGAMLYHSNGWTALTRDALKQKIMAYFGAVGRDLNNAENDTLEILYTGPDVPSDAELVAVFTKAMSAMPIERAYSYVCSMEKNVALMVLFKP